MKLLLSFVLFLGLAACGNNEKENLEKNRSNVSSSSTQNHITKPTDEEGFELDSEGEGTCKLKGAYNQWEWSTCVNERNKCKALARKYWAASYSYKKGC